MTNDIGTSTRAVEHFHEAAEHYAGKYYEDEERTFMTVRQECVLEMVDALNLPGGAAVLDAGCGPGYLATAFAERGFNISAMDGADGMIRSARERVTESEAAVRSDFVQADIESLPYADSQFDLVCSTGVIEYLETDDVVIAEMKRVLKPGGYLLLPVTSSVSPINWLDRPVEFLKRQTWFRRPFNMFLRAIGQRPVLARNFRVRLHRPATFRKSLDRAGLDFVDHAYFYFLPWPRPLDKFFPRLTARLGHRMERFRRTAAGPLAEGYATMYRKSEG